MQTSLSDLRDQTEAAVRNVKDGIREAKRLGEARLQEELAILQHELEALRRQIAGAINEIVPAPDKPARTLRAHLAQIDVQINKIRRTLGDLDRRLKRQITQLEQRQQRLEKEQHALREKQNDLRASLSDLKDQTEVAIKSVVDRIEGAKLLGEVRLQEELATIRRELEVLSHEITGAIGDVAAAQDRYRETAQTRLAQIDAQIGTIRRTLGELETRLKRQIAQLEQRQQQLEAEQRQLRERQANIERFLKSTILPGTEQLSEWVSRVPAIPVQQQQFCLIVNRFYDELAHVYRARNEIKRNAIYRDRQKDMAALLKDGAFENWIVRVVEVTQATDGSAAVMMQPPCRVMLGSDACQQDRKKIRATIPAESLLFRELERLDTGDFVVVSGKLLYAERDYPDRPLPTYALYQAGSHCSTAEGGKEQDVFVTDLNYLVRLR